MKKIMMTLAAVAVAATMNAQTWVGGSLRFNSSHVNGADNSSKNLTVAPEIGYNLDENFAVAVKLTYTHSNPANGANTNTFGINPYARYTFLKAGNFCAFLDGGIGYSTTHTQGAENNTNAFAVSVVPGIGYALSEKVGLVAHLGDGVYFTHTWIKDSFRSSTFGLDLTNGISFGAYYNF
jgi:hypothetical protein